MKVAHNTQNETETETKKYLKQQYDEIWLEKW